MIFFILTDLLKFQSSYDEKYLRLDLNKIFCTLRMVNIPFTDIQLIDSNIDLELEWEIHSQNPFKCSWKHDQTFTLQSDITFIFIITRSGYLCDMCWKN